LVRKPVKDSDYSYFVCSTYKRNKDECRSHSISEKLVYDTVLEVLKHHILRCAEIDRLMSFIEGMPMRRAEAMKLQKQIALKQEELEKISHRKVRLYEDYADGVMDKAEYERFKHVFDQQHSEAKAGVVVLENELSKTVSSDNKRVLWIEHFKRHHTMEYLTRPAIVELIERIEVYEGKRLEIKIRYRDEFEAAITYLESATDYLAERKAS
jgi:hypothetical protein